MAYTPENNPYIPGDPYSYDLKWMVSRIKELKASGESAADEIKALKAYIDALYNDPDYPEGEVQRVLQMMYDEGLFDILLSNIINDYNYTQPDLISEYASLDDIISELDDITASSSWISSATIATSLLGNPIKIYTIGKPGVNGAYYRQGLIIGNQHAREYQTTYVIANTIKMIIANLEAGTGSIMGKVFSDIFTGYKIHFVPTGNPDGYKLTAEDNYTSLPAAYQASIASMVETYIRDGRIDTVEWSDFSPLEYDALLADFNNDLTTYTFRAQDIKRVWKANLAGTDLHYNSWDSNNETELRRIALNNNYPTVPAASDYIGSAGFNQPEDSWIPSFISSNNIWDVYDMHQRGPTCFYLYRYDGRKLERANLITQAITDATHTPINHNNNGPIGFAGWFHAKYPQYDRYCCIKEIGWGSYDNMINGASISPAIDRAGVITNPLPRSQSQKTYYWEVNGILAFIYYAVNNIIISKPQNELYFKDNVINVVTTEKTLSGLMMEYYNRYPNYASSSTDAAYMGKHTIIIPSAGSTNTPNILIPGITATVKIVIEQIGTFSIAKAYNTYGDIWECTITQSASTPWRLVNPRAGKVNKTGAISDNFLPEYMRYEPICVLTPSEIATGEVSCKIYTASTYYQIQVTSTGAGSTPYDIHYIITSQPYPSQP